MTKLDILDIFDEIKIGVKYLIDGEPLPSFPGKKNTNTILCNSAITS